MAKSQQNKNSIGSLIGSVTLFLAISLAIISPVSAQAITPPGETVLICVEPVDDPEGAYLFGFTATEPVSTNALGFVISEQATISVYGSATTSVAIGLYHITPDAQTGGYRRDGRISTAYTSSNMLIAQPCGETVQNILGENFAMSIPLPVSSDQAFLIQVGNDDQLDTAEFLGTVGLHFFAPETELGLADIQLIQMGAAPIELVFPYLNADTKFALVANKEVLTQRSFTFENPNFLSGRFTNPRDAFVQELLHENPPISLFDMITQANFRFYPGHGLLEVLPTGGLIRLELSPAPALRTPQFDPSGEQSVHPLNLDGIRVRTFRDDLNTGNQAMGMLDSPLSSAKVVGLNERGHLLVEDEGQQVVIEAWLVEVLAD